MLTSRALGRDIHFNYFSIAIAVLFSSCSLLPSPSAHTYIICALTQAAGTGEVRLGSRKRTEFGPN